MARCSLETTPKLAATSAFFLQLAGIFTIKEIKGSAVDIRAIGGRVNKLCLELLRENAE